MEYSRSRRWETIQRVLEQMQKGVWAMACEYHQDLKEQVQDHEVRIRTLEVDSVRLGERLESLCKELSSLTSWIKALFIALVTAMGGFIIWYIQSLPR